MEKTVLYEKKDAIAVITLNRPERHNSFCQDLLINLYDCLDEAERDPGVRVSILTGNGKSFCSGIDLSVIGKDNLLDPRGDGKELPDILESCKKPIIGAVNGNAITGGFELALNCDFLIASENAKFTDSHAKVGIHPGWGMTQLLQQAVGRRMAKQMSFTCKPITAQEALRLGLVNEVVPLAELMPRAMQIAQDICAVNPEIMSKMKDLIELRDEVSFDEAFRRERQGFHDFIGKAQSLFGK